MDFLKLFSREEPNAPISLPSGTFTIDRSGKIVTSTISKTFPEKLALEIGHAVIDAFRKAKDAELVLSEISINFAQLKLTARELKGGAIVFVSPRDPGDSR
jgi:hypothetical protein